MTRPEDLSSPIMTKSALTSDDVIHYDHHPNSGLTKRELFAAMAMQGIAANEQLYDSKQEWIAQWAVKTADALIEALNEGKEKP